MLFAGIPALQQAGRQAPPPRKHPGAIRQSQSLQRAIPPPSKHLGASRRNLDCAISPPSKHPDAARRSRSRSRNAKKLLPIYATGNMKRVGGKHEDCKL